MLRPRKGAAVDDDAAERRAVAPHKLRERMDDDVRAVLDRAHQDGSGHRIVDDERHGVPMRHVRERLEIADIAGRIAHGLAENRARVLIDQRLDVGGLVRRRESHRDPEARQDMREQRIGRAVELRHGDDIAAHLRHVECRVIKRRLSRGDAERRHAPLELRDALLEHGGGGVGDARVPETLDLEIEQRGAVRGAVEGVGGGLVDGHGHRFGGGVRVESPVYCDGLPLHARCLEERATV